MRNVWVRNGAIALLAVVVSACGGGGGGGGGLGLDDLNEDGTIKLLAFGDSITRGVGDGEEALSRPPVEVAGYPARLQAILGVPVVNQGRPGEESSSGRSRLADVLADDRPDYVILLEGVNDLLNGRSDAEIVDNLIGMVGIVIGAGAQPILATLPPTCCDRRFSQPESRIRSINARIVSFATVNMFPVIDFFSAFVPDPTLTNPPYDSASGLVHVPEGLHPTPLGYDVMAATASEIF